VRKSQDTFIVESIKSYSWVARFFSRLSGYPDPERCWIWTKYVDSDGYGRVGAGERSVMAHRVVWIYLIGTIPPKMYLDHAGPNGCKNKDCANPNHLQLVTNRHNVVVTGTGLSARNAKKECCLNGHPFTAENLLRVKLEQGIRVCQICELERTRVRHQTIRDAAMCLGLTQTAYVSQYGGRQDAARAVLATAGQPR
jgi:hypothetical protein